MGEAAGNHFIRIPLPIFESAETKEELEDWLLANDQIFLDEMRKLKTEAEKGVGQPISEVAKKWDIKL